MFLKDFRYRRLLKLAVRSHAANLHNRTLELLSKAIKLKSNNSSVYSVMADCHSELDQFHNAYKYINLALEMESENVNYLLQEIVIHNKGKQFDIALSKFSQLPLKFQTLHNTLEIKAWTLYNLNQIVESIEIYEDLIKQNENNSDYLLCIADCHNKLGNDSKSLKYTTLAVEKDNQNSAALNNLGYKLLKKNDFDTAIINLKQAIKIDPKFAFAYNNLGFAYLRTEKLHLAFDYINESLKLDSNNSYAYKNLALCYIEQNQIEKAIQNLILAKEKGFSKKYGNEVDELLFKLENKTK